MSLNTVLQDRIRQLRHPALAGFRYAMHLGPAAFRLPDAGALDVLELLTDPIRELEESLARGPQGTDAEGGGADAMEEG